MLETLLKKVAVIGAAGKMGSGISLLLLQEMAQLNTLNPDQAFELILVDANPDALSGLQTYLKHHLRRHAERNIGEQAGDEEILNTFVDEGLKIVRYETDIEQAKAASLIFEAIVEDVAIKLEVFSKIDAVTEVKPYYFSNTSSIPISVLDKEAKLGGRILGFHFYNPPPVQKLLEVIPADTTKKELTQLGKSIAGRLNKVSVFSKDVAGFIGNGHFMREIDYALKVVKKLEHSCSTQEAIWMVNCVTHEFLIRPMGIFQLLDYVGLDVCQNVFSIMNQYLGKTFDIGVITGFLEHGLRGGQHPDGSQKNGILQYQNSKIIGIWDGSGYGSLPEVFIGDLPEGHVSWKQLHREKNRDDILKMYFKNLFEAKTEGCALAKRFLLHSRDVARGLVADGVAGRIEDVNTVLMLGFYHLYGAENSWIPENEKSFS